MKMSKAVENLMEDYALMQEEITKAMDELTIIHREERSNKKREIEQSFALKFELARAAGVKRYELEKVLKTKDGNKYRYFVELGGGELNRLKNADERAQDRVANWASTKQPLFTELGIIRESVGEEDLPEFDHESGLKMQYKNGKIWPHGDATHWQNYYRSNKNTHAKLENIVREERGE